MLAADIVEVAERVAQLNKGSQKEDIESCVHVSLFLYCLDGGANLDSILDGSNKYSLELLWK